MKKFKNVDEIKLSTNQINGQVFKTEDLDLIWITNQKSEYTDVSGKPYIIESFGSSDQNTVELTVYDMENNKLHWNVIKDTIRYYDGIKPNTVVLSPGDDLRSVGLYTGQYRIIYEFYKNSLGSAFENKLFVEEISPSRKEIRVRPVKVGDDNINEIFYNEFLKFSDNGITKEEFINLIKAGTAFSTPDEIIQDKDSLAYKKVENKLFQLYASTQTVITKLLDGYDEDILIISDQEKIINQAIDPIMTEVFGEFDEDNEWDWYQTKENITIASEWRRVLNSLMDVDSHSGNIDYYINFGEGNSYPVVNWIQDAVKYTDYPYSIIFKLYEPLPKDIKKKQQLWISRQIIQPVINKVFLFGEENPIENGNVLNPPNFNIDVVGMTGRTTGYESWTDLISTQPSTSQDILNQFMSSSEAGDIALNINYGDYSDFIHFGSAEERLKNFKYKLELIDTYNTNINTLSTYSSSLNSSYISQSKDGFRNKIQQVKNGFDSYEKHLYYISGSNYSGSLNAGYYLTNKINEWPKKNTTYPYELYETTSSVATNWYSDQLAITQVFDTDNIHSFRNNLPDYITTDENNEDYLTFMYMVGQHFDTIFTYIKQMTLISNRDESLYDGLAKDLTYNVASSMGFDLYNGNDNVELWKWAFGYDVTGSYNPGTVSGSGESHLPYGDVSKEIWRRILNNLPYITKTKGSSRSIKALMACYGIPTSLLTIREYGGPDPRDYPNIQDKSAYIFDDFIYAIDFEGSQNVYLDWKKFTGSQYPQTIEFRFSSANTTEATQSLLSTDSSWGLSLMNSGSGMGYLELFVETKTCRTEDYRYFDNEFNSVMIRYIPSGSSDAIIPSQDSFELWTKKAEIDNIVYYSSASLSASSFISESYNNDNDFYIGFGSPENFTGSIQEFKLYNPALSESVFENHTRWPKGYNANDPERTFDDLVLRYSFDEPKNHNIDNVVSDVKPNQTYTNPGTANGFSSEINYTARTEEFAALTPEIGGGRFINNKIRLENNELISDLSPRGRAELGAYDRTPNDSAKLGIYFSPNDAINKDIIATYAGIDLASKIGDPRDRFNDKYTDLSELQYQYWKKFTDRPQFNDFIRVIKQYDQSFFNQLKALIPARAKPIIGILVEPTILDRNKVEWSPIEKERNDYSGNSINAQTTVTQSWQVDEHQGTYQVLYDEVSGNYILYSGEYDTEFRNAATYYSDDQTIIDVIQPIQDGSAFTKTYRVYANDSSSYQIVTELLNGHWILGNRELESRMWYDGTLNTIYTTVDGKEPVEISFTNPNKLKATDTGPSKIRVE